LKIECPSKGGQAEKCDWRRRQGQVRDFPNVGVIECQECHLVTHGEDLSSDVNYESGSMHNWAQGYGDSLPGPESDISRRAIALKKIAKTMGANSILDFGCGEGAMLSALSSDFNVIGVEPDIGARDAARKLGHKVFESTETAIASNTQVHIVTLFHVIEHFYEASLELNRILELLEPGGIIVIETPNSMDALLSKYESEDFSNFTYWSHHPMLHSDKSLALLLERSEFEVIEKSGVQRYNLNNHLYWLSKGRPGGHVVWKDFSSLETVDAYEKFLIQERISDTLWIVARKP
jgi:2-polyprenyl-3-methyl-5-hydroxy-6-metoxy-1,4-benzoquinol methylase